MTAPTALQSVAAPVSAGALGPGVTAPTVADWLADAAERAEDAIELDAYSRLGKRRPEYRLMVAYYPGQDEPCGVAVVKKVRP